MFKRRKVSYSFTIKSLLFGFILIWGISLVMVNAKELWAWNHTVILSKNETLTLEVGNYVCCEVDEYVVQYYNNEPTNDGVSETYLTFLKDYDTYTIPYDSDKYIRLKIFDKKTIDKLEDFEQGKGKKVLVKGKIVEAYDPNYAWFDGIEGIEPKDIIKDICIMESDDLGITNLIGLGVILICVAVIFGIKTTMIFDSPKIDYRG